MANWFIGLPVTAAGWFERVGEPPLGVRLFHPEDLHLTVAFFGAVEAELARAAFAQVLPFPLRPLVVSLGKLVPLGNRRRPSALSAVLEQGEREVAEAIGAVRDRACEVAGVARDPRPPLPHLTLARPARQASDSERQAAITWARALDLGAPRVPLREVALYTWAQPRGPRMFAIDTARPLA